MNTRKKQIIIFLFFLSLIFSFNSRAEDKNIYEVLELIQKDLRTLEKAVYSDTLSLSSSLSSNDNKSLGTTNELDQNSEDVLTRHLLKLSEIEKQFQDLTNKFEEINFKLDKLSTRLSKVQADNQLRFQTLEKNTVLVNSSEQEKLLSSKTENNEEKILPGSSQPQD